jgi:hypothetical protein
VFLLIKIISIETKVVIKFFFKIKGHIFKAERILSKSMGRIARTELKQKKLNAHNTKNYKIDQIDKCKKRQKMAIQVK